jgi:ABC-type oligopeptide transport system ATPase subunit
MSTAEFQVSNLHKVFERSAGHLMRAVDGVSFEVPKGQRLGIVGESGSGKSTLIRMLDALIAPSSGQILFRGRSIIGLTEPQLGFLRSQVQVVFQDPQSSLDPRMRVNRIITEALRSRVVSGQLSRAQREERLAEVLNDVGLEPRFADRYPHQLSGGQRQRVAIARALAPQPSVLIADEAVSALDVSIRAQILNLLLDLVEQKSLTLLFVSHDLSVVRHICDRVLVMRHGRIVESGPVEQIYEDPRDPYTKNLLAAIPRIHSRTI